MLRSESSPSGHFRRNVVDDFESYRPPVRPAPGHTGPHPGPNGLPSEQYPGHNGLPLEQYPGRTGLSSEQRSQVEILTRSCKIISVILCIYRGVTFRIFGVDNYIQPTDCSEKQYVVFVNILHRMSH